MIKYQRGDWGYIKKKKFMMLLLALIMAAVGVGIYLMGYFLNENSNRNLFTILAVLMVLPGAKFLVSFLVLLPYQTPKKEQYDILKKSMPAHSKLFSDMVITSTEKVMNLDFILVSNQYVVGVVGKEKQDIAYIQDYLTKGVRNWSSNSIIKVCTSVDEMLRIVKKIEEKEINKEEEEKVIAYLTSLVV